MAIETVEDIEDSYMKETELLIPNKNKDSSCTVFKMIKLNPGLTKTNFICCLIFYVIFIFSNALPGALQPLIILHSDYYNIPQSQAGKITSLVLVIQLVVKIATSIPYGHLTDKFGRKTMLHFANLNFLVGSLIIPTQTEIFPGFVIAKSLTANSACAFATIPLLADYVADESKGKASALVMMCFGIGALVANLLTKFLLYAEVSLGKCYVITGIFVFVANLINSFGLKSNYQSHTKLETTTEDQATFLQQMKEALQIFIGNGWLRILLVLQILGSSDFQVFFTFMTVFVKSLFPEGVDEATQNIVVNNLQTLVIFPMIFGNIGYGYLLDKKNTLIPMSVCALAGGAVSFVLVASSSTPYSWTISVGAFLLGSTLPGLFVISSYIGIKNYPPDKRGIMIGFSGLIGYIGFFIIATGGGILYDSWRREGPFIICTGLLILAIILVLIIYRGMKKE